ncbi:MAG TPA: low molecular weight protein arginine phosphatase [Virgibacillus sp.]|nr:low molecular weight protein arginine phosphatase [Virgibacillus sp.]
MNVLFVCTGNTCRSPMAEALLKYKTPDIHVLSAGIFAGENEQANHHTIEALKQKGIKLNHLSQPVTEKLLRWADLVITMTTQHKQSLIMEHSGFQEKYYTLKEYVSTTDKEIWDELKSANADVQEKRLQIIRKYQHQVDNTVLEDKLHEHLQDDLDKIRNLESNLTTYDISDPFGGDFSTYKETMQELERYIDQLIEKMPAD